MNLHGIRTSDNCHFGKEFTDDRFIKELTNEYQCCQELANKVGCSKSLIQRAMKRLATERSDVVFGKMMGGMWVYKRTP